MTGTKGRRKAPNGRGSVFKDAQRDLWHGYVTFPADPLTGKRVRKHVSARSEAEVIEKVRKLEAAREGGYKAVGDDVTLSEWLGSWIEAKAATNSVRPRTIAGYRSDLRLVNSTAIAKRRLSKLTPEDIDALFAAVRAMPKTVGGRRTDQPLSVGTVMHLRRTLSAALNTAVDRGRLARNPVRAAHVPRYEAGEIQPLTIGEVRRILDAAREERDPLRWSLALALGKRQGEVLGLLVSDVSLESATLHVQRQLQRISHVHGCQDQIRCVHPKTGKKARAVDCPKRRPGGGLVLVPPKTRAKPVALPDPLLPQLRTQLDRRERERKAAGPMWRSDLPEYLFCDELGRPIDPRADYAQWRALLARAGVRPARLHDARHTAVTTLLAIGVSERTVQDMMSWSSAAMLGRYAHVLDSMRRDAAEKIGAALWADDWQSRTMPRSDAVVEIADALRVEPARLHSPAL